MIKLLQELGTPIVSLLTGFSSLVDHYRIKFFTSGIIEVSKDRVSAPSFHFPLGTGCTLNIQKTFKDGQFHKK